MDSDIQFVFHMVWCVRWMPVLSFTVPGHCLNLLKPLICRVAVNIFPVPLTILLHRPLIFFFPFVLPKGVFLRVPTGCLKNVGKASLEPFAFLLLVRRRARCMSIFLLLCDHFNLLIQDWYKCWKFSIVGWSIPLLSSCIVLGHTRKMRDTFL